LRWPRTATSHVDEFVPHVRVGSELERYARIALGGVQDDLSRLDGKVEYQVARKFMRGRLWAITALIQVGIDVADRPGNQYAKEVLLDVTAGAPLTICFGERYAIRDRTWTKKTVGGEDPLVSAIGITVPGYRSVFPDVTRTTGGHMWPWFCERCRSSTKKPHRDRRAEVVNEINAVRLGADATVYYGAFHLAWDERG